MNYGEIAFNGTFLSVFLHSKWVFAGSYDFLFVCKIEFENLDI